MDKDNKTFRSKVYDHLHALAQESPAYDDAKMLVGSADTLASLKNNTVYRSIDTEWIEKIEYAIPYLDAFIRNPGIAIQENEEVLPVEITKKVSEKSIRYLAQHTNHILKIENEDVIPSKLLNVFRDESLLTYENKFINTLLVRLLAFIEKRYSVLEGTSGIEKNYVFDYRTSFDHALIETEKNSAKLSLKIELTSPFKDNLSDEEIENNKKYSDILLRLSKIRSSITAFLGSPLITAIGKNYIRPPVIRTNPILKNKNLNACLTLWEYIESVDKVGYSVTTDEFREMPSDDYVYELYSSVALQYLQFYSGVVGEDADNRLLSEKRLNETFPDFEAEFDLEEVDDYTVYDTDYKKLRSISSFIKNKRKLSEDERKMRVAIEIALRADRIIFDAYLAELEEKRIAEEKRLAELEALRLAEEKRLAELEQRKNINYRYIRTFLARLIQSDDALKADYSQIKNTFLSYKKVKSRISKKCETFNYGRNKLAKVDVKGKKIYLYLALDPSEFVDKQKFYNFIDISEKNKDFSMLIKVNGPIKLKRALELIDILMQKVGAVAIDNYLAQDFYLPYEDTDTLVRRGLIIDLWNKTPMEEPAEEVAITTETEQVAVAEETEEKFKINYEYIRTFLARLIQSEDKVKEGYSQVKNKFLSYKKVRARISKKCETFSCGRNKLAKLNVKGKKVDLYLALDPTEFVDKQKFYNFIDVSEKNQELPMLIKVNGPIKLKRALELIDILMQKVGAVAIDNYQAENYVMPYESTKALIEKGLIIELVKHEFAEEPIVEESAEEVAITTETEQVAVTEETEEKFKINYEYIRTFLARLIQSEDKVKEGYSQVKNKFLSYKKVRARISKKCETFSCGRNKLAKLNVKGKKVDLYLALDPTEFVDKQKFYNFIDASEKNQELPMLIKVNGPIKLKRALELIDILMQKVGAVAIDNYQAENYVMPYESTKALIEKGLIIELVKHEFAEEPIVEEPVEEVAITSETEQVAVAEETEEKFKINYEYIRTFLARLIQSEDKVKEEYSQVKNKFLSYKKVRARISKKCETFSYGRNKLAKLNVKGKKVDLYLALDPTEFVDKQKFYNFIDVSEKNQELPMLIKVNGPLKLKRALELIDILMQKVGAVAIDNYQAENYVMPYESTKALIEKGLIIELVKHEFAEEPIVEESAEEVLNENEEIIFGLKCVFKPYYKGYENSDSIVIAMEKQKFERLKERKQKRILMRANKKRQKKLRKTI